ncbi:vanadium-dependent haloperoxidase [Aquibacillus koreensis]|uniref:Vanadium-dependent haloperoxidase n=2 Tax=Aquibacillus koreensis TaxID=279446 RepID=A0A9X3WH90_9BACI|nr:vanadium-dependent haloperoxidase [Aquibacillus koreensis]MCT2534672.1 vanadium-dependent haloperoxidase [Aquibacillus koreensis]MDC3419717.1 vanadium-dependent haloperoxidase [Aquibacillus koreensis]
MVDHDESYKRWTDIPYAGETRPPNNPIEPFAGSWRTYFIQHDEKGGFETLDGRPIRLAIKDPNTIDFEKELKVVQRAQENINEDEINKAIYWGAGPPTKQWTPIVDRLIDSYSVEAPRASRILAALYAGLNDAFVVAWSLKYKWQVARPNQIDQNLATIICTPVHPSYPSGHAVVSGAAEIILSYFFPTEHKKLHKLAEENATSRLYGGVHFPSDNKEGLRLGRQIGNIVVREISKEKNNRGSITDTPYRQFKDAELNPPPYEQVIPYEYDTSCQSLVLQHVISKQDNDRDHLPKPKLFF